MRDPLEGWFGPRPRTEWDADRGVLNVYLDEVVREEVQIRKGLLEEAIRGQVIDELRKQGYTITPPEEEHSGD